MCYNILFKYFNFLLDQTEDMSHQTKLRTYDDYLGLFDGKTLTWCEDQLIVLPANKKFKTVSDAFCKALYHTISKKRRNGEKCETKKRSFIIKDEEINGTVRMIPCGGKGQMIREVVPHNFDV